MGGMGSTSITVGPYEVAVHQEWIDVTSNGPRPDPSWEHTDTAGHVHRWVDGATPTLRWVEDGVDVYDDGDGYIDEVPFGHSECAVCGERVDPGMVQAGLFRESIAGARHVDVRRDGVPVVLDSGQAARLLECRTVDALRQVLDEMVSV